MQSLALTYGLDVNVNTRKLTGEGAVQMYPIFRMAKEFIAHRNAPALKPGDTHVSHHICWPWDIDPWMELNNGRTLTLFDLGRLVMLKRCGAVSALAKHKWGATVAGSSVRYRARVRMFQRVRVTSQIVGADQRFNYITQEMWRGETCTSQSLLRIAITDKNGIVPSEKVRVAMKMEDLPQPPDWVVAWTDAEATRPWPPNA